MKTNKDKVLRKTGGLCMYCGCFLTNKKNPGIKKKMTIEHMIPKSKGGLSLLKNLFPSCIDCNRYKGDLSMEEFRVLIGSDNGINNHMFFFESIGLYRKIKTEP